MIIYNEGKIILKDLYKFKKLNLYHFHNRYKLSPIQIIRSLRLFKSLNIVTMEEYSISITDFGEDWIFANRRYLFLEKKNLIWKNIPLEMQQDKIEINQFYVPNRKKIDPYIYKLKRE